MIIFHVPSSISKCHEHVNIFSNYYILDDGKLSKFGNIIQIFITNKRSRHVHNYKSDSCNL